MKLILDFGDIANHVVKITSDEDKIHSYKLAWKGCEYSLWYDDNTFVWEKQFLTLGQSLGYVTSTIIDNMVK